MKNTYTENVEFMNHEARSDVGDPGPLPHITLLGSQEWEDFRLGLRRGNPDRWADGPKPSVIPFADIAQKDNGFSPDFASILSGPWRVFLGTDADDAGRKEIGESAVAANDGDKSR